MKLKAASNSIISIKIRETVFSYFSLNAVSGENRKNRKKEYVIPRQIVAYFLRKYLAISLDQAGQVIFKNHATVLYSIQVVKDCLDVNDKIVTTAVKVLEPKIIQLLDIYPTGKVIKYQCKDFTVRFYFSLQLGLLFSVKGNYKDYINVEISVPFITIIFIIKKLWKSSYNQD